LDAAQKLQLGGLLQLAGLGDVSPSIILGCLLELGKRLTNKDEAGRLRAIGAQAFVKLADRQGTKR
jgi:Conjugal transfer protein TraD